MNGESLSKTSSVPLLFLNRVCLEKMERLERRDPLALL